MFFLIPIGSEAGVRRLPFITLGLIAVNTIIWIVTAIILSGQVREIEALHKGLFAIERQYTFKVLEKDPLLLRKPMDERFHAAFAADSIIAPDDPNFKTWNNLRAQLEAARQNVIFEKLGLKPNGFNLLKLFTSMFVHANFLHLAFNMLFLWMVGCNIEDVWGRKIFLGLYLLSGAVAALCHIAAFPQSTSPLVGASGAIAGIMGAYLIRHFKTKIRIAYFFLLFIKPYVGTFSVYAGVALPFWLLEQLWGASWSAHMKGQGTAYLVHIGGFVFGAAIGLSMKLFGLEEKYVAPMIEESFEKLKLSPVLKEAHRKLDDGDAAGALPLLLQAIREDPRDIEARLMVARLRAEKGEAREVRAMYDQALGVALASEDSGWVQPIYEELKERKLLDGMSEDTLYRLATYWEKVDKPDEAVKAYDQHVQRFPSSRLRPKAIYRLHRIYKDQLNDEAKAQTALVMLKKNYPDWVQTLPSTA